MELRNENESPRACIRPDEHKYYDPDESITHRIEGHDECGPNDAREDCVINAPRDSTGFIVRGRYFSRAERHERTEE